MEQTKDDSDFEDDCETVSIFFENVSVAENE
jgi:hypothetical protein